MRKLQFLIFFIICSCSPEMGLHKPVPGGEGVVPSDVESGVAVDVVDYNTIKPVFAEYCSSCHPSRSEPDWLIYINAKNYVDNGSLLRRVIKERSMPPLGSREAALFKEEDRKKIQDWIEAGAPRVSIRLPSPVGGVGGGSQSLANLAPTYVQACLDCHGVGGPQSTARHDIPKLGGLSREYLAKQLDQFKWNDRIDPNYLMNQLAANWMMRPYQKSPNIFQTLRVWKKPVLINCVQKLDRI